MSRRFPTQIHHRVSRMMKAHLLDPPLWYDSVLRYPPLPLPPKAPPERGTYDTPPLAPSIAKGGKRPLKDYKNQPQPIYYMEDYFRRQFFRDHPFEAFRPVTLIETDRIKEPHHIEGLSWTRLRQRGRNPSVEDCLQFAVNLVQHHSLSASQAYARATSQFRALKAENYCALQFSLMEAEEFGAIFGPTEIQLGYLKERQYLDTWETNALEDQGARLDRKRWKPRFEKPLTAGWSRGQEYVRMWQRGLRPDYTPESMAQPTIEPDSDEIEELADSSLDSLDDLYTTDLEEEEEEDEEDEEGDVEDYQDPEKEYDDGDGHEEEEEYDEDDEYDEEDEYGEGDGLLK